MPKLIDRHQRHFFFNKGFIVFEEAIDTSGIELSSKLTTHQPSQWLANESLKPAVTSGVLAEVVCSLFNTKEACVVSEVHLAASSAADTFSSSDALGRARFDRLTDHLNRLLEMDDIYGMVWLNLNREVDFPAKNSATQPQVPRREAFLDTYKQCGGVCVVEAGRDISFLGQLSGNHVGWVFGVRSLARMRSEETSLQGAHRYQLIVKPRTIF